MSKLADSWGLVAGLSALAMLAYVLMFMAGVSWSYLINLLVFSALIALPILFVVWSIKTLASGQHVRIGRGPLEIAKERYARGEINRGEFEEISDVLKDS